MADKENTKQDIVCIGPGYSKNNRTRTTSFYEFIGVLGEQQIETPTTPDAAVQKLDDVTWKDAGLDLTLAVKQAKALHDLLSFFPDESEASGQGERFALLRSHYKKHGPLSYATVYYLLRFARSDSYTKVSRKQGRQSIKEHPNKKKKGEFEAWAIEHIKQGATPQNITAIKRLDGFNKTWGTDDTIKKWWRGIENAPALKPGATRT